ncbi:MAG: hypothetical protein WBN77_12865, partial [Desulfobacterales bacterium]
IDYGYGALAPDVVVVFNNIVFGIGNVDFDLVCSLRVVLLNLFCVIKCYFLRDHQRRYYQKIPSSLLRIPKPLV